MIINQIDKQLDKQENESELQYIWRVGNLKDSGILDITWDEIADAINKNYREDESLYRSEAAYRKPYQQTKKYFEAGVFNNLDEDKYVKELQIQKQELEKEKVKTRDERNELRRVIREEARKESYQEQLLRNIKEFSGEPLEYDENKRFNGVIKSDNDLIISLTDIHTGIEIDNFFNKFNNDILKQRLNKYLDKIFEVQLRHGSENIYVVISEVLSGIIHNSLRIENNQDMIQQFLSITNYLNDFLAELSYRFENVHVYVCMGNHSRISPKKEDSIQGENMDLLIIPFLSAKLQNFNNIHFHDNEIEETIAMFSVRNNKIMASHGDRDDPKTVVQKYTMLFEMRPDIVYLGHRHTNSVTTVYNSKVIQSGCISGTDSYSLSLRLKNKPEQTISVITENGLDCLYDVTLD